MEKHPISFFWKEKIHKQNNSSGQQKKHPIWWYISIRGGEQFFFSRNAIKTLNIDENSYIVDSSSSITDPVDKAINTYKNHPSILLIKQKIENVDHFWFKVVSISETEKELRELNSNKTTTFGNIPTKILNQSSKSCSDTLQKLFNDALRDGYFPDKLKCTDIAPVFKKDDPTKAKNYRPVSVLPGVSKIFERLMHKQISFYIDQFLSPYMCGYRKSFSTTHFYWKMEKGVR